MARTSVSYSLRSIGIPVVYRTMNPFALTAEERLDAFPTLGNPLCTEHWLMPIGDSRAQPHSAWETYLAQYVRACGVLPAFVLDTDRRNRAEEVRSFLALRRKLIRNYVESLNLLSLPVFRSRFRIIRNENSWWLRAEARIIKPVEGIQIGQRLQRHKRWLRTHCPEYRGAQSWHCWLQPGVTRTGFSTAGTETWIWYEIRCPHNPGTDGNIRHLDDNAFEANIKTLWLPIVKTLRWSNSNPRLLEF